MATEASEILYKDEGCHLHPSCLSCPEVPPLSMCVFDFPGYEVGWRQYKEIKRMQITEGLSISEIAARLNVRPVHIRNMLAKGEKLVLA